MAQCNVVSLATSFLMTLNAFQDRYASAWSSKIQTLYIANRMQVTSCHVFRTVRGSDYHVEANDSETLRNARVSNATPEHPAYDQQL